MRLLVMLLSFPMFWFFSIDIFSRAWTWNFQNEHKIKKKTFFHIERKHVAAIWHIYSASVNSTFFEIFRFSMKSLTFSEWSSNENPFKKKFIHLAHCVQRESRFELLLPWITSVFVTSDGIAKVCIFRISRIVNNDFVCFEIKTFYGRI